MAQEKITGLPNEALGIGENDLMLISKEIAPTVFESQKINPNNLFYDSGYKNLPFYNGSFGITDINNGAAFTIVTLRIVNRTVFLGGNYILPLSTNASGMVLAPNWQNYNVAPQHNYPFIYQGAGGFDVLTNGSLQSESPLLPPVLCPAVNTTVGGAGNLVTRSLTLAGTSARFPMQSLVPSMAILANGKLVISSVESREGNGNSALSITSPLSEFCSIYRAGDRLADYTNYGSGFTAGVSNRLDITQHSQPNRISPLTIDTRQAHDLGGFYVPFNSFYNIDINTPMDAIIAAFDALP